MEQSEQAAPGPAAARPGDVMGQVVERAAFRRLLANRAYRNLLIANASSSLGDWIGFFAILALTERLLGGDAMAAFGIAGVMIARVLPSLLLGTVAGVLTDRWDRKRVMVWTDILRGFVMIALAFSTDAFQLLVATFVSELMSALFIPAKDATVPNLVDHDDLVHANQISLASTYGTLPVGSLLFALITAIAIWVSGGEGFLGERPAALAIFVNALTFFISAWFITRVPVPARRRRPRADGTHASAGQELREGWRFVATHPLIRTLILGITAAFLAAGVVISTGTLLVTRLNAGNQGFGILGTAVGVGLAAGMLGSGRLAARLGNERVFPPSIGVAGVALMATALVPRLELAMLTAAFMGAAAGVAFVAGYTMLQRYAHDEVRGRTFAAFNAAARLSLFSAMVVAPAMVGAIGLEAIGPDGVYPYTIGGTRMALLIGGAVALGGAVWTGRSMHVVMTTRGDELLHEYSAPRPARHGILVVFEGGEGAGKSTQVERLREAVRKAGYRVVITREPGGTPLSEEVRAILLEPDRAVDPRAEALLYAAARAQHVARVIRPALDSGAVVICDRFVGSSIVYQGVARGLGTERIREINAWATGDVKPDLTILLDVDPEVGLARARPDHDDDPATDRLEGEGIGFHRVVNEAFRHLAEGSRGDYLIVDAGGDPNGIALQVAERVLSLVEEHTTTMEVVVTVEGEA